MRKICAEICLSFFNWLNVKAAMQQLEELAGPTRQWEPVDAIKASRVQPLFNLVQIKLYLTIYSLMMYVLHDLKI